MRFMFKKEETEIGDNPVLLTMINLSTAKYLTLHLNYSEMLFIFIRFMSFNKCILKNENPFIDL